MAVANVHGRKEFLRIEESYLRRQGDQTYLPGGFIYEHPASNSVLIELPLEADSGVRRLFVPRKNLLLRDGVPT